MVCELGLGHRETLSEELVHEVAQRVQARPLPNASEERLELSSHRIRIESWLAQKRPLRLRKVHTLLVRDHGVRASYDTLRRFAIDELGWRKKAPTVLVADGQPGQEAQVDFGLMGTIHDVEVERARRLYVLIVTLVVSRYQFVWPTFLQTTEAVCEGLDATWRFFGAMAHVLVPDNMAAMIAQAEPDPAPIIVASFQDYVQDARDLRRPCTRACAEGQRTSGVCQRG